MSRRRRSNFNEMDEKVERQKLLQKLDTMNLKLYNIEGDGNCLFRSLSDQFDKGDDSGHLQHRAKVCDYIEQHKEQFQPYILEEEDQSIEQRINRMRRDGTYGGNIELVAFSQLNCVKIWIYQGDIVMSIDDGHQDATQQILHIAYHSYEHYSSIRDSKNGFDMLPKSTQTGSLVSERTGLASRVEKLIQHSTLVDDLTIIRAWMKHYKNDSTQVIEQLVKDKSLDCVGLPRVRRSSERLQKVAEEKRVHSERPRKLTNREKKKARKERKKTDTKEDKDVSEQISVLRI